MVRKAVKELQQQSDHTVTIKFPAGTPAGTQPFNVTLPPEYRKCNGVTAYILKAEAGLNFRIGIRDNNVSFLSKVSFRHIAATETTPMNDRAKRLGIPGDGKKVYVDTEFLAPLTEDLEYDLVFSMVEPY